jgi:hypothetical protein
MLLFSFFSLLCIQLTFRQAAIVAQISITALVLPSLNQTHWVAKGFLNYSLVAALIAVYYSTTQHRIVGRFLKPQQIRLWIRGGLPNAAGNITNGGLIGLYPSTLLAIVLKYFPHLIPPSVKKRLDTFNGIYRKFITLNLVSFQDPSRIPFRERYPRIARRLFGVPRSWLPRDPSEFTVQNLSEEGIKECLQHSCFTPSASAVITISAAQILLTSSLFSLLIALGIYFGFIWTRNLDTSAGPKESKNVFIMFVTSLGACLVVFLFSRIIQDQDTRTERKILEDYMAEYVQDPENRDTVSGWGVSYRVDSDGVKFSLAPTSNV